MEVKNYFDDEYLTYDLDLHQYILTQYAIETDMGINMGDLFSESEDPDIEIKSFLRRASIELYAYIYKFNIMRKDVKEYVISLPQYREAIKLALEEFVYTIIKNGTDPNMFYKTNDVSYVVAEKQRNWTKFTHPVTDSVQLILDSTGLSYSGKYSEASYPHDFRSLKGIVY